MASVMRQRVFPFLLVLVSFVLYFPVLSMTFLSDDYGMIGHFQFRDVLRCFYARCGISENAAGWYRPTSVILYFIEYPLWGQSPSGYHLTNLVLYTLCVLAVYSFSLSLLGDRKVSFASALLFAVHPIHVDAVSWICARHTLLCVLFSMLSFFFFVRSMEEPHKRGVFSLSLLFSVLALCSREDALILPVVLLLYGLMSDRRVKLLSLFPFFSLVCLYLMFKIFVLKTLGGYGIDETFLSTPLKMIMKHTLAVQLQQLSVPYVFKSIVLPWFSPFAVALIFLILLLMKFPFEAFLTGFLIVAFLPYAILRINVWMGGWYLYFASVPFCILLARGLLFEKVSFLYYKVWRAFALACFAGLLLFYVTMTTRRINDWLYASKLASEILPKITASLPKGKNNLSLYVYGLPHNHKGAFVYANGIETALRMHLKGSRVTVTPTFLLNLPTLQSLKRTKAGTVVLVYMDGNVYGLRNHPRKKGYYLFQNIQRRSFSISYKTYLRITAPILMKYAVGNEIETSMLAQINDEISEALKKHVLYEPSTRI